jgi:hypothetical protein
LEINIRVLVAKNMTRKKGVEILVNMFMSLMSYERDIFFTWFITPFVSPRIEIESIPWLLARKKPWKRA